MRKRGRPRKDIELEMIHKQEAEMRKVKIGSIADGNAQLGAYPLGALFARNIISQGEHDAGLHYAMLYGRVFGRTTPGYSEGGCDHSDAALEKCEAEFRAAAVRLQSISRQVKDAVDNAAVYHRYPHILMGSQRKSDQHLLDGLKELDRFFHLGRKAAA